MVQEKVEGNREDEIKLVASIEVPKIQYTKKFQSNILDQDVVFNENNQESIL